MVLRKPLRWLDKPHFQKQVFFVDFAGVALTPVGRGNKPIH